MCWLQKHKACETQPPTPQAKKQFCCRPVKGTTIPLGSIRLSAPQTMPSKIITALQDADGSAPPATMAEMMTTEATTSIRKSASSCLREFFNLIAALEAGDKEHRDSMPPEKIEREYGRFKIWSGNLGALQSGRSSLDFRLRDSAVMQMNVSKLLDKLDNILRKSEQSYFRYGGSY